jgi:hypothetical protein
MNHRSTLLTAVFLVAVAACNDDDPESPSTTSGTDSTVEPTSPATESTTTTSTTSAPPTTTAPPATTTSASTEASTTIATDVDWRLVVETLGQRRQDLFATPDVSRIPDVCADDSQCADQLNVQIADLASKGWRVAGADPFVILDAQVERFDGDTLETSLLVTVVAVIQRPAAAGTIVDSAGSTIAAVEPDTEPGFNARGRFLLGRVGPPDDPWRFVSQDTLPEVPA